jgi:hypothetical protein
MLSLDQLRNTSGECQLLQAEGKTRFCNGDAQIDRHGDTT